MTDEITSPVLDAPTSENIYNYLFGTETEDEVSEVTVEPLPAPEQYSIKKYIITEDTRSSIVYIGDNWRFQEQQGGLALQYQATLNNWVTMTLTPAPTDGSEISGATVGIIQYIGDNWRIVQTDVGLEKQYQISTGVWVWVETTPYEVT